MMMFLDQLKVCTAAAQLKGPAGAASRIRRRVSSPVVSEVKPPSRIPKACYNKRWLKPQQPQHARRVDALKLSSKPDIKALLEELEIISGDDNML
jgi:hypothetical protein